MTTKNKLKFGSKDLLNDDALDPKNIKLRITTFINEDELNMLKSYAKKRGSKYQTLLNSLLGYFFDKPEKGSKVSELSEERVRKIVREELS
jgi:predicted DNA binding CopG/RHH family protein